jgi:hypothetical protein
MSAARAQPASVIDGLLLPFLVHLGVPGLER